jgi:hypothetical protein
VRSRSCLAPALVALVSLVATVPAEAAVRPVPSDAAAARRAGLQAGPMQTSTADTASTTYRTYRVYATQYVPNTPGSLEVAVPDRCAKFASLGWTSALASAGCPSGYRIGLRYRVRIKRDSGQVLSFRVKDVGPWNIDDNYWDGKYGPRPRRRFRTLKRGMPEAEAAFYNGFHTVKNCKTLSGAPSGHAGPADQFGRCVLNPAGIDISVAAAAQLGLRDGRSEWVTASFLWEPMS